MRTMPAPVPVMTATARRLLHLFILLAGTLAQVALADDAPRIVLSQEDTDGHPTLPEISASAAPEPLISFELLAGTACPAATTKPELLVSIASATRVMPADRARQAFSVQVPLGQLPWLADLGQRCITLNDSRIADGIGEGGQRLFRLHAVTAAFASLSCTAANGETRSVSSALPLDAWLACPAPADPAR